MLRTSSLDKYASPERHSSAKRRDHFNLCPNLARVFPFLQGVSEGQNF